MNRLSICVLLVAGLTAFCGTASANNLPTKASLVLPAPARDSTIFIGVPYRPLQGTLFYWYSWPYDTYNDRKTIPDEEWEMWFYYAALVDTDPSGGELIERGYLNNAYPHNMLPSQFLYVHFVYSVK